MATSLRTMQQHLAMFQQTFSNALTESSPRAQQPPEILVELFPHQLAAMDAMQKKEIQLKQGYPIPSSGTSSDFLFSDFAIYADGYGLGKSLSILGHIANMKRITLPSSCVSLTSTSTPSLFSLHSYELEPTFNTLLVVPFSIFRQWQDTISTQSSLNGCFLKTQRDLDKETLQQSLEEADVTLVSNTLLPSFLNTLRLREISAHWKRVVYDEADTIKLTSTCPHPMARMTWLIAPNFMNLFLYNACYNSFTVRQLPSELIQSLDETIQEQLNYQIQNHPCMRFFRTQSSPFFSRFIYSQHPYRGFLVVRCSNQFVQKSVELPPLYRRIIQCQSPLRNRILENALTEDIQELLHAGDVNGALQKLGVSSHTPLTLVDAVTKKYQNELERYRSLPRTDASERKIQEVELEMKTLQERLSEISNDACAICFDSPTLTCITPCCSRIFCASCILEWMTRVPSCPLCREVFHPNALVRIGETCEITSPVQSKPQFPKKIDALLTLLRENPQGKFVLFSRFNTTFHTLHQALQSTLPMAIVQGNKDVIANMIDDFDSGILRLLMIENNHAAAGLNIPGATHIVFMHRMDLEEEKQILARAYRIGRTQPLVCVSLLHERE